jgi:hypothetical protein
MRRHSIKSPSLEKRKAGCGLSELSAKVIPMTKEVSRIRRKSHISQESLTAVKLSLLMTAGDTVIGPLVV